MVRPADNPFATHRIESIAFDPQGPTWEHLLERLAMLHYRACILGQQGSGKTTFLSQLEPRLRQHGWQTHLWLHHGEVPRIPWKELARLTGDDIVLFDGADLLPRWQWQLLRILSGRAGGLVVVSHTRPLLPTLLTCQTSRPLLEQLLKALVPQLTHDQRQALATELYDRHQGNIREAFREAYDRWASLGL